MNEPRDCHTQWSQRQISYDSAYMWNLKKRYKLIDLQNRNKITDVETNMVTKVKGWRDKLGDWDWQKYYYI